MLIECIRDNARVHGVKWAAEHAARNRVNIDVVLQALGFRRVGEERKQKIQESNNHAAWECASSVAWPAAMDASSVIY